MCARDDEVEPADDTDGTQVLHAGTAQTVVRWRCGRDHKKTHNGRGDGLKSEKGRRHRAASTVREGVRECG